METFEIVYLKGKDVGKYLNITGVEKDVKGKLLRNHLSKGLIKTELGIFDKYSFGGNGKGVTKEMAIKNYGDLTFFEHWVNDIHTDPSSCYQNDDDFFKDCFLFFNILKSRIAERKDTGIKVALSMSCYEPDYEEWGDEACMDMNIRFWTLRDGEYSGDTRINYDNPKTLDRKLVVFIHNIIE